MAKLYKINISLPDYSYLPKNIDVLTHYYGITKSDEAKAHLDRQCQILKDWMNNDPSCNVPVTFIDITETIHPVVYQRSFIANPGNVKCIFEVVEEQA